MQNGNRFPFISICKAMGKSMLYGAQDGIGSFCTVQHHYRIGYILENPRFHCVMLTQQHLPAQIKRQHIALVIGLVDRSAASNFQLSTFNFSTFNCQLCNIQRSTFNFQLSTVNFQRFNCQFSTFNFSNFNFQLSTTNLSRSNAKSPDKQLSKRKRG